MGTKKTFHVVAFFLTIVGGINWGLVGLLDFNLVEAVLGSIPSLEQLVYILVGVSAVYLAATHGDDCKACAEMMGKKK